MLSTLALRIRVASVAQVGHAWFSSAGDPLRAAGRRLERLAAAGWVESFTMMVRPPPPFEGPLAVWNPGEAPPDFGKLATRLAARWNQPLVPTPLVIATERCGIRYGGTGGRRPRPSEATHDIALAAVYFRRSRGSAGAVWHPEAELLRQGFGDRSRLPDAIVEEDGLRTVVELGGVYTARKLAAFHGFCRLKGLPYELW